MKKMLRYATIIYMILLISCSINKDVSLGYTHNINPKHTPITFIENNGKRHSIKTGKYVEVLKRQGNYWKVKIEIEGEIKKGKIPVFGKTKEGTIIYLAEFDENLKKDKTICFQISLPERKALTFRLRPLNNDELEEMIHHRGSNWAKKINQETVIFGLQNGVEFDLLKTLDKWYEIKVYTKNFTQIGYISKKTLGQETLKNNCQYSSTKIVNSQ